MIFNRSIFSCLATVQILFSAALAQTTFDQTPTYDPKLEVKIRMKNGQDVILKGPNIPLDESGESYYNWEILANLKSPDGRFSAIQYYGRRLKYQEGFVYLVNLNGKIIELKNSLVNKIVWTNDSKYLIGIGDSTLRIWNINGMRRQLEFGRIVDYHYVKNSVCLNVINYRFDDIGQHNIELVEKYIIPSLKKISSIRQVGNTTCDSRQ